MPEMTNQQVVLIKNSLTSDYDKVEIETLSNFEKTFLEILFFRLDFKMTSFLYALTRSRKNVNFEAF